MKVNNNLEILKVFLDETGMFNSIKKSIELKKDNITFVLSELIELTDNAELKEKLSKLQESATVYFNDNAGSLLKASEVRKDFQSVINYLCFLITMDNENKLKI